MKDLRSRESAAGDSEKPVKKATSNTAGTKLLFTSEFYTVNQKVRT